MYRRAASLWLAVVSFFIATQSVALDAEPSWTYEGAASMGTCPAGAGACDLWVRFRTVHPWPYQAISIGTSGDEKIVILSETPPHLTREDVSDLVRASLGDANVVQVSHLRWPTGQDGWLEDAVVRVHASPEIVNPMERLPVIAQALFGTADGFRAVDLDSTLPPSRSCSIQELAIGPSELSRWLAEETAWRSLDTGQIVPASDLRGGTSSGAFVREDGLLVGFAIARGMTLADYRASFRRFAVASDLVLGASAPKAGSYVLLARRRSVPQDCLPPLRFETFALFARTANRQLAQSYERQRLFAGKVRKGAFQGWDWAPIYLSGELDDTEFGTLLNLADQVLKSWSQHGSVSYFAFEYPQPESFPFGDKSATDYFTEKFGTNSLVFNWNTSGLGLVTSFPSKNQLLTVDRTGALPILYIPSGGLVELLSRRLGKDSQGNSVLQKLQGDAREAIAQDAEEQAHQARGYFASLGDPILTRVVQNVTIYQALRAFAPAGAASKIANSRSDITVRTLRVEATRWLTDVAAGKNSRGLSPQTTAAIKEVLRTHKMTPEQMAEIIAAPETAVQRFAGLEARRRELYTSLVAEEPPANEAARVADAAFQKFCRDVNGTITPVSEGEKCEYRKSENLSYELRRAEVSRLQASAIRAQQSVESVYKSLVAADQEISRLNEAFAAARKLGEALHEETQFVSTLGNVLENVQNATSADLTVGTIRTPALVMSRDTEDAEAIGGHNIDAAVTHAHVVPGAGQAHFEGNVGNRVLVLPPDKLVDATALAKRIKGAVPTPERTAGEALKISEQEPDTLLDVVRRSTVRAEDAELRQGILAAASECECDILIVRDGDVFRIVRNRPAPPQSFEVVGKTGLVDAIAGPPPGRVVRFEGIDPQSVEYIAQSVSLIQEGAGRGGFNNFVRSVRDLFRDGPKGANEPQFMIWGKRRHDAIRVVDENSSLGQALTSSSTVVGNSVVKFPGSMDELASAVGLASPRPTGGGRAAVVVRFSASGKTTFEPLGIYTEIEGRTNTAAQIALEQAAAMEATRLSTADFYGRVSALADNLRNRLTPSELHFFRSSKLGRVQVTQLLGAQP
jgi:hypothetical protein